jgi:hypothetical protein
MSKATMGTYLEVLQVAKFVIDIKNFSLKTQTKENSKLESGQ